MVPCEKSKMVSLTSWTAKNIVDSRSRFPGKLLLCIGFG